MEQDDALLADETGSSVEAGGQTTLRRRTAATLMIGFVFFWGVVGWGLSHKDFVVVQGKGQANYTIGLGWQSNSWKKEAVEHNIDYAPGANFEQVQFERCALIGAGAVLSGKGRGAEIDGHDTVIRTNRVSTPEWYNDFGQRTDVLFVNEFHQDDGKVVLMGAGETESECDDVPSCRQASIIVGPGFREGCPSDWLKHDVWGGLHPMVGCTTLQLKHLSWRFRDLSEGYVSTGFIAFLTFAPICTTLDMYGFEGTDTADGHSEWSEHPLDAEHTVEHHIAAGEWDQISVDTDGAFPELAEYWAWFKEKAGGVTFV